MEGMVKFIQGNVDCLRFIFALFSDILRLTARVASGYRHVLVTDSPTGEVCNALLSSLLQKNASCKYERRSKELLLAEIRIPYC